MEHRIKSQKHHPRMNTNFRSGQMQTGFSFVSFVAKIFGFGYAGLGKLGEGGMVTMLKTLDQIAREKQRDVMYLTFHHSEILGSDEGMGREQFDWQESAMRKKVIGILERLHISYQACFSPLPTDGTIIMAMPYNGEIYIDMPYDESNELLQD